MKHPIPNTPKAQAWHKHLSFAYDLLPDNEWNDLLEKWEQLAPDTPPQDTAPSAMTDAYIGGRYLFFFLFD